MRIWAKVFTYISIILLAASIEPSFGSESIETKRVFILYSFKYGLSGNALMDDNKATSDAIQTAMQAGMSQKIAFHSERMDVSTLPEDQYFEGLRNAFGKKYADQPFDLIITVHYRALSFLIRHGEEIWPRVPILFCGVEKGRREQLKQLRPNITGIFADALFGDMLETVFKIHPETKRVTMIVGASDTERFIEARIRKAAEKFAGRAEFIYLSHLGFDEILGEVANLPPDSVVFFLTLMKDGQGKPVPENSLHLISRVASAPVYGLFDVYVGHGIVGGSVYSAEFRGARVGEMGVRILKGQKPQDIPMETWQKHFSLYDGRQLSRWGISDGDLPPDSVIRFRNPTFYEAYKRYIWSGIFLMLIQSVLIVYLLINRSRRMRVEQKLMERESRLREVMASRAFLQDEIKHLDRVATMGNLTAAIAHEIGQPLTAILSNAQAAIRFLNRENPELNEVREALVDIVVTDKHAAEVIQRLRNLMKKKKSDPEIFELHDVIRGVVGLLNSQIVLINASVKLDIDNEIPAVRGDRVQIQQVILNLLLNALHAVKTRPEDMREVRVSTTVEEQGTILVTVRDSGPGIEKDKFKIIFETFHTSKEKGLGMGLSICKSIVEQHNGRIWAENDTVQGAVISFTLPVNDPDTN